MKPPPTPSTAALLHAARAKPFLADLARHVAASLQGDSALGPGELVVGPAGQVYPFLHFPLAPEQQHPNSILGRPPREPATDDAFVLPQAAKELWDIDAAEGRLVNRRTYRLAGTRRENNALKLDATLGAYRDSFLTQDWLERELLLAVAARQELPEREFDAFLQQLPARRQLLANLEAAGLPPGALLAGTRFRSAAMAVAVLLVFRDDAGRWCTPVRLRSTRGVLVHGAMFHVVPSGMFQPTVGDPAAQWDLDDFLDREFGEELFGEDFDEDDPATYRRFAPIRLLRSLLADPAEATFRLIGYGYNIWNLRPEILVLLSFDTPDWYRTHVLGDPPARWQGQGYEHYPLRFNDEFLAGDYPRFIPLFDQDGRPVPVDAIAETFGQGLRAAGIAPVHGDPFHPAHWVPSGAAAFWLGLRALTKSPRLECE
jgi:hypothetical protein